MHFPNTTNQNATLIHRCHTEGKVRRGRREREGGGRDRQTQKERERDIERVSERERDFYKVFQMRK